MASTATMCKFIATASGASRCQPFAPAAAAVCWATPWGWKDLACGCCGVAWCTSHHLLSAASMIRPATPTASAPPSHLYSAPPRSAPHLRGHRPPPRARERPRVRCRQDEALTSTRRRSIRPATPTAYRPSSLLVTVARVRGAAARAPGQAAACSCRSELDDGVVEQHVGGAVVRHRRLGEREVGLPPAPR